MVVANVADRRRPGLFVYIVEVGLGMRHTNAGFEFAVEVCEVASIEANPTLYWRVVSEKRLLGGGWAGQPTP